MVLASSFFFSYFHSQDWVEEVALAAIDSRDLFKDHSLDRRVIGEEELSEYLLDRAAS